MSDTTQGFRQGSSSLCCGCTHLFRAFRMAIQPAKLILAFCCVFGTYLTGRVLDAVWPTSSMPLVVTAAGEETTELAKFLSPTGGRYATRRWIDECAGSTEGVQRAGPFKLLLDHARTVIHRGTSAIVHADLGGLIGSLKLAVSGKLWLLLMHPIYAVIFFLISLAIWSLFGGALCRAAALHATRDERIALRDALAFAKGKFASFFAAPLMPLVFVLILGVLLFAGGLIGAIPWAGEVVVGLLFFLAVVAGIAIAFVIIGAVAGSGLMFPTIAVEGSDAFDALSRSYSYIYQRPWRTAFFTAVSAIYGGICLLFVKWFVRLALWAVHLFVGLSMNWGSAATETGTVSHKLDAIWQGPSLVGGTTFWGGFATHDLANSSWFARVLFCIWIFTMLGVVGAFMVSFFYSASTLIYLLLRREVDATDLEDVYVEEAPVSGTPVPPSAGSVDKGDVSGGAAQPTGGSP